MGPEPLKVMAIDDIQDNLTSLKAIVSDAFPSVRFISALNGFDGIELVRKEQPDVILLDIVMPGMDGFEVCLRLKSAEDTQHIPVIFLTALETVRSKRIKALEVGGEAFLSKPIDELELTVTIQAMVKIKKANLLLRQEKEHLAELVAERTSELEKEFAAHRQAAEALSQSERDWRLTFDAVPDLISIIDLDHTIIRVNRAMADCCNMNRDELTGRKCYDVVHGLSQPPPYCPHVKMVEGKCECPSSGQIERLPGYYDVSVSPLYDADGNYNFAVHVMHDITARKQAEEEKELLEAQLQQAHKMESVGRLAGGVAHDFNNMLTVILGHSCMALMDMQPSDELYEELHEIQKAAERSADLTRQLLAFARKQTVAPRELNLNETIGGMLKMLQRLIGEDISLNWLPEPDLWHVMIDPSQIDQILANLCVNARDSISNVGNITIETRNVSACTDTCTHGPDFKPGMYVSLSISDNGCGIDKDTLEHIFEPFFTTKAIGEGTGLGLATVYGAVKQNNGFINVKSEPGQGTRFTIYLPRYVRVEETVPMDHKQDSYSYGHDTILVVEDELSILKMTTLMLEKQGYTVLTASSSDEAIQLAREHAGEISLLLSDVVMPEMNGRDLSNILISHNPKLKSLFMSGYTSDVIANRGILDHGVSYIQKPFSIKELTDKVREVLDGN